MISLIWAMAENGLIGKGNKIPWHIKEDLVYYKSKVEGQTVLMGEETYYSLKEYYKGKPLPYGKIYVASLNNILLDDAFVVDDLVHFLNQVEEDIWIVGGATIYKLALPFADRLYISFVKGTYDGDKFFPSIDFSNYHLIWEKETDLVRYTLFERVKL